MEMGIPQLTQLRDFFNFSIEMRSYRIKHIFLALSASLFMISCEKDVAQRSATLLECDPIVEIIPGAKGIYQHLAYRGNTLFAGSPISGDGGLIKYENDQVEILFDHTYAVMELALDDVGNLWICISGGPQTGGIYRYDLSNEMTRVSDRNCSDFEIGNDGEIFFIGGEGLLDSIQLQNILKLDASNGEVSFATDPNANLFNSLITTFLQSTDGTFWTTTFDNQLVHTTSDAIIQVYSNSNEPLFPLHFNGLLLLSEQHDELLFSFVKGKDWQVIEYQAGTWKNIDLVSAYIPAAQNRLIYRIEVFEGDWYLSSNWGVYQISPDFGLLNHMYAENSPLSADHINRLMIKSENEIWVSYFDDESLVKHYCP